MYGNMSKLTFRNTTGRSIAGVVHFHRNCHTAENIITPPSPQTSHHPCEDSAARPPTAEYDQGVWRYQLLSPLRLANAEIPTGDVPCRPFPLSLLNSNCRSGNCSSRRRCIPFRLSSAPGVSKTGIGSISQSGYWRSGASPSIQISTAPRDHSALKSKFPPLTSQN